MSATSKRSLNVFPPMVYNTWVGNSIDCDEEHLSRFSHPGGAKSFSDCLICMVGASHPK